MLWPGYAAPAQSPWGLPAEIPAHPQQPLPVPVATSAPSVSAWSHSKVHRPVAISAAGSQLADVDRGPIKTESDCLPVPPDGFTSDRCCTAVKEEPSSDVAEEICLTPDPIPVPLDPVHVIRIKDEPESHPHDDPTDDPADMNEIDAHYKDELEFAGLRLLSDSVERFVAANHDRNDPAEELPLVSSTSCHPLDVLCAAALSAEHAAEKKYVPNGPTVSAPAPASALPPPSGKPSGFQLEFDFRSKLAEIQRKYKEKQKELSSLSKLIRAIPVASAFRILESHFLY